MGGMGLLVEAITDALDAVTETAGNGVWGQVEEFGDLLERVLVPDFEDDNFALFGWQGGEAADGGGFGWVGRGGWLEPGAGLEFAGEPAPETAAVIEGPMAKGPEAVASGFVGGRREFEQGEERFLQHVLGFAMGKAEGAPVENQTGGLSLKQVFAPGGGLLRSGVHSAG